VQMRFPAALFPRLGLRRHRCHRLHHRLPRQCSRPLSAEQRANANDSV
jgi:hypothetical protein